MKQARELRIQWADGQAKAQLEQIVQLLLQSPNFRKFLLKFFIHGPEHLRVDLEACSTGRAGECRVSFQLSQRLRYLRLALRAWNFYDAIAEFAHKYFRFGERSEPRPGPQSGKKKRGNKEPE